MTKERKHPKGLPFLFLTEMWERFGFYLILGIFTLYLTDSTKGFGFLEADASDMYGTFLGLIYLTPFLGGLLADRTLGYRASITIGGILMGLGYLGMSIPNLTTFYISMALIIFGNGFFKPNISTLLGNIYNDERYIARKDSGYNIFYMGINIGAFICNFFGAYLYNRFGWGEAFQAAGIGMFIGLIIFWIGNRHYVHADVRKPVLATDMGMNKLISYVMLPALAFGAGGFFLYEILPSGKPLFGSRSTDAFFLGSLPVIIYYISLYRSATREEKRPVAALLAIFGVSIIFWAIFKQNGTVLTYWARNFTDREVPAVVEGPTKALLLAEELKIEPTKEIEKDGKTIIVRDSVTKYDALFRAEKGPDGKVVKTLAPNPYYNNLPKEEWPEKGSLHAFNTNLFQSINPFFVIILTPLVVGFFAWLRRRKREPSTPSKIGWGMVITALSTLVMVGAVYAGYNGMEKVSMWWLVGSYAVITVGELFLSPMGLSLVSKLSPARYTALMMGGWFLATSLGIKISGSFSSIWDSYEEKEYFFMVNCVAALVAAAAVFLMLPWLRRIIREHLGKA